MRLIANVNFLGCVLSRARAIARVSGNSVLIIFFRWTNQNFTWCNYKAVWVRNLSETKGMERPHIQNPKLLLTILRKISQNGQVHFKNLAAFAARFLKCVWPFWEIKD